MSWETLEAMLKTNRDLKREYDAEPPDACPLCGDLLDVHPVTGVRNCPLGHWTWRGGPKI